MNIRDKKTGVYWRRDRIRNSTLDKNCKHLLDAMLHYADPVGVCWPSKDRLADDIGCHRRTVQRTLRTLEELKILRGDITGGRTSTRYTIDFNAIPQKPEKAARPRHADAVRPWRSATPHVASSPSTMAASPRNRGSLPHEPTIHNKLINKSIEHNTKGEDSFVRGGWMDGEQPALSAKMMTKDLLRKIGVQGRNLELLAARPEISFSVIDAELRSVRADPATRNVPAVLVSRLAKRFQVELASRPRLVGKEREVLSNLESIVRHARTHPDVKPLRFDSEHFGAIGTSRGEEVGS